MLTQLDHSFQVKLHQQIYVTVTYITFPSI
jgi:hypothetical protein